MVCTLKRYLFSKKVVLAILEHFYAEMAAEPLFYRGLLHLLSLQILLRMISCFHQG
jgi:hypothetical protein